MAEPGRANEQPSNGEQRGEWQGGAGARCAAPVIPPARRHRSRRSRAAGSLRSAREGVVESHLRLVAMDGELAPRRPGDDAVGGPGRRAGAAWADGFSADGVSAAGDADDPDGWLVGYLRPGREADRQTGARSHKEARSDRAAERAEAQLGRGAGRANRKAEPWAGQQAGRRADWLDVPGSGRGDESGAGWGDESGSEQQIGRQIGRQVSERPAGRRPVRLTRRGRLVLLALVLLTGALVGFLVAAPGQAADPAKPAVTAVVQPGDTLWSFAERNMPGWKPKAAVAELKRANDLEGYVIHPGQRLVLPARR